MSGTELKIDFLIKSNPLNLTLSLHHMLGPTNG